MFLIVKYTQPAGPVYNLVAALEARDDGGQVMAVVATVDHAVEIMEALVERNQQRPSGQVGRAV